MIAKEPSSAGSCNTSASAGNFILVRAAGSHRSRSERFTALFAAEYAAVARYVSRVAATGDVEDVVADTFVVAWRRLGDVPDPPRAWLLGVARRSAANRRRGEGRRAALADRLAHERDAGQVIAPADDPADTPVLRAYARLSPADREVLALVSWDGLDGRQAAAVIGCSAAAFRVRLHRARRRLERLIDDERAGAAQRPSPQPTLATRSGKAP